MYITIHSNYQPALIKLDNENIGWHFTPLQSGNYGTTVGCLAP